jgi:hypothetical protein
VKVGPELTLDAAENAFVQDIQRFLDDKLVDDGQTMPVATLYKNFMGIRNSWNGQSYGLTRRMVQLYLLCLAQRGEVRVILSPRAGLSAPAIDYANIGQIDFSARVLGGLEAVQKMAQPENWHALRPYAAKLLDKEIAETVDDARITQYRRELRDLFAAQREEAARALDTAPGLFAALGTANPYERELEDCTRLFARDLGGENDIRMLLYALKEVLGFGAFDRQTADQAEVDELANRLKNYRDLLGFLKEAPRLRAAAAYCELELPDLPELREVRSAQAALVGRLADPAPYIDAPVRLKTEIIGGTPPAPGERDTFAALTRDYRSVYTALHQQVLEQAEASRAAVEGLGAGERLRTLEKLEGISALQPPVSVRVRQELAALRDQIFSCANPAPAAIAQRLKEQPQHDCGLDFGNAERILAEAAEAAGRARALVDEALASQLRVLLAPAVRERLRQGESERVIAEILACADVEALAAHVTRVEVVDGAFVETVNRYLKEIVVVHVRLADFRPKLRMVEREGLADLALEFQAFLEERLGASGGGADVLPVLQLE